MKQAISTLECGHNPRYETAMDQPSAALQPAEITLDDEGVVRSRLYGDIYFSTRGAIAETQHVFLAGNHLPARFLAREYFTIGELGFGTGLNFLVAWKTFVESGASGRLHMFSVEKHPLTPDQLRTVLAHYPELDRYAQALLAQYPLLLPGLHRLQFGPVSLTLGFGDALDLLRDTHARVDAWFLDGFSPARNDTMWSQPLLQEVARLSAPDATFATFTVARAVRDGLKEAGFATEKRPGFAHKRDMLTGTYEGTTCVAAGEPPREDAGITIIGAGMAGATLAHALAERGYRVTVYEKETIASDASGNPAGVLYPQLTKYYQPATAWHFTGYDFTRRKLQQWQSMGVEFHRIGMLKIARDAADEDKLRSIRDTLQLHPDVARWVERDEASSLAGADVTHGGFWFEDGIWLPPEKLCRTLLSHPNITLHEHHAITTLDGLGNDPIILANAHAAHTLSPHPLKLGISAGQVSHVRTDTKLRCILCHRGYAIPQAEGMVIGATYDRNDTSRAVTAQNHEANMADLARALAQPITMETLGGRTSIRATTPDRLPYVGKIRDGLWVSAGHGSRGLISAPLAAEVIASAIAGEMPPVTRPLLRAVDPLR